MISHDLLRYCDLEGIYPADILRRPKDKKTIPSSLQSIERIKQTLTESGVQASGSELISLLVDEVVCGETQLSALEYLRAGGTFKECMDLARLRIKTLVFMVTKVLGTGTAVYGIGDINKLGGLAAIGQTTTLISQVAISHAKNAAGSIWRKLLEKQLNALHDFVSLESFRHDGFSAEEIASITSTPNASYSNELIIAKLQRLENVITPVGIAIALAARGNLGFALLTTCLGLLSHPIGETAYKISDKFRARQFKLGRAAKNAQYTERTSAAHIRMTDVLNSVAQTDKTIIALLFLLTWLEKNNPNNLLSQIYSVGYGLMGLNGTLTMQRSREYSRSTSTLTKRVIDAFNSKSLILTQSRWLQHVTFSPAIPEHESRNYPDCERGLLVENFSVSIPNRNKNEILRPVSFVARVGKTIIIKGSSGSGKSTLISGIQHVLEHQGRVAIIRNGIEKDVHSWPSPQSARDLVKYFSADSGLKGNLIDLFSPAFLLLYPSWKECSWQTNDDNLVTLDKTEQLTYLMALETEDGLLKQEIEISASNKEKQILSESVSKRLQQYRAAKEQWLQELLKSEGGNLALSEITPFRGYDQLSAGQKQRVTLLLAEITARTTPEIAAIVLDEPLDKLDPEINFPLQLAKIGSLKNIPLIIITNQHLEKLQSTFDTELVVLEKIESTNS